MRCRRAPAGAKRARGVAVGRASSRSHAHSSAPSQVARLGYYPPFISLDDPLLDANAGIAMKFVADNTRDRCSPKLNLNFQRPKRTKARGRTG